MISASLARAFQPCEEQVNPWELLKKKKGSLKQATFPRNSWYYYYYFRKQNLLKGIGILPDLGLKKKGGKNNKRKKKFRAFED